MSSSNSFVKVVLRKLEKLEKDRKSDRKLLKFIYESTRRTEKKVEAIWEKVEANEQQHIWFKHRLEKIEKKIDGIDKTVESIDNEAKLIKEKVETIGEEVEAIGKRLEAIDKKFEGMERPSRTSGRIEIRNTSESEDSSSEHSSSNDSEGSFGSYEREAEKQKYKEFLRENEERKKIFLEAQKEYEQEKAAEALKTQNPAPPPAKRAKRKQQNVKFSDEVVQFGNVPAHTHGQAQSLMQQHLQYPIGYSNTPNTFQQPLYYNYNQGIAQNQQLMPIVFPGAIAVQDPSQQLISDTNNGYLEQ